MYFGVTAILEIFFNIPKIVLTFDAYWKCIIIISKYNTCGTSVETTNS